MNNLVALLGDTHWDISDLLLDSQIGFIENQFVPYLNEKQIDTIIQVGDLFDNRKHISINVINKVLKLFETTLKDFKFYCLLGNHDVIYRNSNEVHSLKLISQFPNVKVFEENTILTLKGRNFLFVPWIYDLKQFEKYVQETDLTNIDVVCGHFDIINAKMGKNNFSKSGLTCELLHKFPRVYSGHYHSRSVMKNGDNEIEYIGSSYQLNFGDSNEERGFHILNCDDLTSKFIENKVSVKFVTLNYPEELSEEKIKGNKVNVYLNDVDNVDSDDVSEYLEKINKFKPISNPVLKTIENFDGKQEINNEELKVKSLKELFVIYIDGLNLESELKEEVIKEIDLLYSECQKSE